MSAKKKPKVVHPEPPSRSALEESAARLDLQLLKRLEGDEPVSEADIRFAVQIYYELQQIRESAGLRIKSKKTESLDITDWFYRHVELLEKRLLSHLDIITDKRHMGRWAKAVHGIGPVIAAGLMAHIDIRRCRAASGIWRLGGLDPSVKWIGRTQGDAVIADVVGDSKRILIEHIEEISRRTNLGFEMLERFTRLYGEGKLTRTALSRAVSRRPWSADFKVLCWKIGDSFMKQSGNPKCKYGQFYAMRKQLEIQRNERGEFKDQAAGYLKEKRYAKATESFKAYDKGRLPDMQITRRAARYATKLFLAHWFDEAWRDAFATEPPKPYAIQHLGHVHWIRGDDMKAKLGD